MSPTRLMTAGAIAIFAFALGWMFLGGSDPEPASTATADAEASARGGAARPPVGGGRRPRPPSPLPRPRSAPPRRTASRSAAPTRCRPRRRATTAPTPEATRPSRASTWPRPTSTGSPRERRASAWRLRDRPLHRTRADPGRDQRGQPADHLPLQVGRRPRLVPRQRLRLLGRGQLRARRRRPARSPRHLGPADGLGKPGRGKWMTVYANPGHTYVVIAGLRFDTAGNASGEGPRWHPADPYPSGYCGAPLPRAVVQPPSSAAAPAPGSCTP